MFFLLGLLSGLVKKERRPILDVATEETEITREELERLLDPEKLIRDRI
ncbi:MAG: hypothetical protein IBX50_10225 [Marinospirillum sp.]|nr:hypothetical protein [Marinospirillum sp.]MBE0507079.1 hypothetical protein [Marinospirillum sp.]